MRSTIGALVILEEAPAPEDTHQEFERLNYFLPRMCQQVVEVSFGLAPSEEPGWHACADSPTMTPHVWR